MSPYAGPAGTVSRAVRIGARTSPLARAQADHVAALLAGRGVPTEFVGITTVGDVDGRQLTEIGGTGVFVSAVRDALVEGRIDLAVHSYKDLPTAPVTGLELAAVPRREDTRDVLIGRRLSELRDGDRIGTGAPRRAMQLAELAVRLGRHLEVVGIRGNVDTRIELVRRGELEAVVLAVAGLRRLGRMAGLRRLGPTAGLRAGRMAADVEGTSNFDTVVSGLPATVLSESEILPAPGQGALALEIPETLDNDLSTAVRALDDPATRAESLAERGFLARLEAGCTAPVGARAEVKSVRGTTLDLTLTAVIGRTLLSNLSEPAKSGSAPAGGPLRVARRGWTDDPGAFGAALAEEALTRLPRRFRNGVPPQ